MYKVVGVDNKFQLLTEIVARNADLQCFNTVDAMASIRTMREMKQLVKSHIDVKPATAAWACEAFQELTR
jgi:hypothetical protein